MRNTGYEILAPIISSNSPPNATYPTYNLKALATAAYASTWSDATSQRSDDTSSTAGFSDSDSCASYCFSQTALSSQTSVSSFGSSCEPPLKLHEPWAKHHVQPPTLAELPAESRRNPRRTSNSATSRTGRPPTLQRQADRKINFVDSLVGKNSRSPQWARC